MNPESLFLMKRMLPFFIELKNKIDERTSEKFEGLMEDEDSKKDD